MPRLSVQRERCLGFALRPGELQGVGRIGILARKAAVCLPVQKGVPQPDPRAESGEEVDAKQYETDDPAGARLHFVEDRSFHTASSLTIHVKTHILEIQKVLPQKRLAPYHTRAKKIDRHTWGSRWRSVFFVFMIFVVMADFPCNVEDTIGYAEDERQQQQNLGQSHAPSLLLPEHREYAPKKPLSRCLFTRKLNKSASVRSVRRLRLRQHLCSPETAFLA